MCVEDTERVEDVYVYMYLLVVMFMAIEYAHEHTYTPSCIDVINRDVCVSLLT